ncbi:PorT family protein [Polaribacter sp.]|nr:PorT family protein [Polaribacter sp.]
MVFKEYMIDENKLRKNTKYKQQLLAHLRCDDFDILKFEYLEFDKDELIAVFEEYNQCNDEEYRTYGIKSKKGLFHLNVRLGLNSSSLLVEQANPVTRLIDREINFNNETALRYGVEAEFIFPFNKNKWATLVEATYQRYISSKETSTGTVDIVYNSFEVPIGVRHYLFLNEQSKLFINSSLLLNLSFNSEINVDASTDLEIIPTPNLSIGVGYNYNNKFNLEFRYLSRREILNDEIDWRTEYKTVSLIFGYSLF